MKFRYVYYEDVFGEKNLGEMNKNAVFLSTLYVKNCLSENGRVIFILGPSIHFKTKQSKRETGDLRK